MQGGFLFPHRQHTDEGDGNKDHTVPGIPDDHPEEDREEDQEEHIDIIFPVPRRDADEVEQRVHDVQKFGLYDVSRHPFIILCRIFDQQRHAVFFSTLLQLFCFRNRNIAKDICNFTGIFHAIAHAGKFQFFRHGFCVCFHLFGSCLEGEELCTGISDLLLHGGDLCFDGGEGTGGQGDSILRSEVFRADCQEKHIRFVPADLVDHDVFRQIQRLKVRFPQIAQVRMETFGAEGIQRLAVELAPGEQFIPVAFQRVELLFQIGPAVGEFQDPLCRLLTGHAGAVDLCSILSFFHGKDLECPFCAGKGGGQLGDIRAFRCFRVLDLHNAEITQLVQNNCFILLQTEQGHFFHLNDHAAPSSPCSFFLAILERTTALVCASPIAI